MEMLGVYSSASLMRYKLIHKETERARGIWSAELRGFFSWGERHCWWNQSNKAIKDHCYPPGESRPWHNAVIREWSVRGFDRTSAISLIHYPFSDGKKYYYFIYVLVYYHYSSSSGGLVYIYNHRKDTPSWYVEKDQRFPLGFLLFWFSSGSAAFRLSGIRALGSVQVLPPD